MKKFLTVICCFAILATTAFAAVGCDLFGGSNVITAGDENSVYAVSMLSGVGMLGVMDENEKATSVATKRSRLKRTSSAKAQPFAPQR